MRTGLSDPLASNPASPSLVASALSVERPNATTAKLTCVQSIGATGVSPSRKPNSAAASCKVFREYGGGKRCSASAGSHG
jgi:hypothetical protein